MDKFDRIQKLHRIFSSRRLPVAKRTLAEQLECTERNVLRLIETMQNVLEAPIEYDPARRGWHYVDDPQNRFELPGLWLTGEELQSLSLLLNLLESLGNGLLNDDIGIIEREVKKLLKGRGRAPCGARGLKPAKGGSNSRRRRSRPLRGAWIETRWRGAGSGAGCVAPPAGRVD